MFAIATLIALAAVVAACFSRRTATKPVMPPATAAADGAVPAVAPSRPRPADHFRKGENAPQRHGRAARVRVSHHMSVARRTAFVGTLVARWNAGRVTAEAWLAESLGADAEFVRRYASPFGREVAKVYRARFGAEPPRSGSAWRSRMLVDCFAYSAEELPTLEEAARTYKRTALLLAA